MSELQYHKSPLMLPRPEAALSQTIFLIEDDESVRRALRRLIRLAGWTVETFATAEEFLQAPEQPAPDCLILDLHLPGLSGLELQQRLHAEGRIIPIIFITAHGNDCMRDQALQAGAIAFLQKPFEERALLNELKRAVG
jgi:FixJ family two-component response regulator